MLLPAESATQGGCFTYRQAQTVGWTYALLSSAVRRHQLHRVRAGVWIESPLWDALDERGRHLTAVRADLLVLPAGWHAGRRSAAVAMQLPLIGALPTVPQLVAEKAGRATSRHRKVSALPEGHTAVRDGIPITTLARTAIDIARVESFLSAVVVMDAVLGMGVDPARLADVLDQMDRWPGAAGARRALDFANGLSESALESLSRVRIHERRLPTPELQVDIFLGDRLLGRADKLWRAQQVVGEDDGMAKLGSTADGQRQTLKALYRRGTDIEDTGLVIARWDWDTAWRDGGRPLEDRVLKAFARAEGRPLDPRLRFVPTTVADRLHRERRWAS